jgi:hypothetical protein
MEFDFDGSLKEWAKDKPLSILQLDPADRAVLRIAGKLKTYHLLSLCSGSVFYTGVLLHLCV